MNTFEINLSRDNNKMNISIFSNYSNFNYYNGVTEIYTDGGIFSMEKNSILSVNLNEEFSCDYNQELYEYYTNIVTHLSYTMDALHKEKKLCISVYIDQNNTYYINIACLEPKLRIKIGEYLSNLDAKDSIIFSFTDYEHNYNQLLEELDKLDIDYSIIRKDNINITEEESDELNIHTFCTENRELVRGVLQQFNYFSID